MACIDKNTNIPLQNVCAYDMHQNVRFIAVNIRNSVSYLHTMFRQLELKANDSA